MRDTAMKPLVSGYSPMLASTWENLNGKLEKPILGKGQREGDNRWRTQVISCGPGKLQGGPGFDKDSS